MQPLSDAVIAADQAELVRLCATGDLLAAAAILVSRYVVELRHQQARESPVAPFEGLVHAIEMVDHLARLYPHEIDVTMKRTRLSAGRVASTNASTAPAEQGLRLVRRT